MAERDKNYLFAYWLMPAEEERAFFAQLIARFARRFDAALFEPHVTIVAVPEARLVPPPPLMKLVLCPVAIKESSTFTKTLYLQFADSLPLRKLARTIANGPVKVEPHLSFLYQTLPRKTRRQLASEIALPFREVRFERVQVMRCISPTRSAGDVRSWSSV